MSHWPSLLSLPYYPYPYWLLSQRHIEWLCIRLTTISPSFLYVRRIHPYMGNEVHLGIEYIYIEMFYDVLPCSTISTWMVFTIAIPHIGHDLLMFVAEFSFRDAPKPPLSSWHPNPQQRIQLNCLLHLVTIYCWSPTTWTLKNQSVLVTWILTVGVGQKVREGFHGSWVIPLVLTEGASKCGHSLRHIKY